MFDPTPVVLSGSCRLSSSLRDLGFGRYDSLSCFWSLPLYTPDAVLLVEAACYTARLLGWIPLVARPCTNSSMYPDGSGWTLSFVPDC